MFLGASKSIMGTVPPTPDREVGPARKGGMGLCCEGQTGFSFPGTDAGASSVLRAQRPRKSTSHSPSQRLPGVLLILESGLESKSPGSLRLLICQMGRTHPACTVQTGLFERGQKGQ